MGLQSSLHFITTGKWTWCSEPLRLTAPPPPTGGPGSHLTWESRATGRGGIWCEEAGKHTLVAPNPSSVAFSDRRHTFLPREETDRIARGLGLAWDQGAGTRDLRGQRHFFRQPPACLLLFPPFGWDVKSGTPRSEVAEECLVSVQFEQVSGREHVLPRLWPNKGKRVTQPFSTVRPAGSLDFGKAYLQLPAGGLPSLGHLPYWAP